MYTDEQILENRRKWIEFLKRPDTKKGIRRLESRNDPESRCCLGHGCFVLGIPRTVVDSLVRYDGAIGSAPESFMKMVGLDDAYGLYGETSLVSINDDTKATPQEIGVILESMIMGGDGTPFVAINPKS